MKFYRELITECIPLFVAAGLIGALCGTPWLAGVSCLKAVSLGLYQLVIPVMAGYKAGRKCGGDAGGLAGALAASAVLMSGAVSAFTASILAGFFSGYIYRKGMERLEGVIPSGFEMLTGNLYLAASGIFGGLLAFYLILPCAAWTEQLLTGGIAVMAESGLLPWSGVLVEPLKILFFNNWLNHGFLLPLGMEQVRTAGGSILFLLEENPGPGFGILAACALWAGTEKKDTASSLVIQMFGGIHEVYFPYVLADVRLLAAAVAGGVAGNYCFMLTNCRLRGPASPGSIITILMMAENGRWPGLVAGILVSAAVSFGVAWVILCHPAGKKGRSVNMGAEVREKMWADVGQEEQQETETGPHPEERQETEAGPHPEEQEGPGKKGKAENMKIYFVCDAGMGSSAMASALFKKKLKAEGVTGMEVFHVSADRIPEEADVLVCQQSFASSLPDTGHPCFTVENLTDMGGYGKLLNWLKGDE